LGAPKQPVDQKPLQFDQDGAPVFPPSRPNTQPATSQAQGQIRNNPDVQVTGAVTKTSNNNANIPKVNFFLNIVEKRKTIFRLTVLQIPGFVFLIFFS
jgi:hypothetical protein